MLCLRFVVLLSGLAVCVPANAAPPESPNTATVWIGTRGGGQGIYRASLNLETGRLSDAELAFEMQGAGFLSLDRGGSRLYSIGTIGGQEGNVASFRINRDRSLTLISTATSGPGRATHLALSPDERTLLLAHYGGGFVASLPISDTGELSAPASRIDHVGSSVNTARQSKPHPHWIGATPDGQYAVVPDLGTDEVVVYRLDGTKHTLDKFGAAKVPPGSGPRHLKFHPNGNWAYVVNELSLTVTAFRYEDGVLEPLQTIPALPKSDTKDVLTTASEIRVHPSGQYLYAGIRGHDVIAVFRVDQQNGKLTFVEREPIRGSWPRNFGIDPTGRWLLAAGADSSTISVFRIAPDTGILTFTRNIIHVPGPICIEFQLDDSLALAPFVDHAAALAISQDDRNGDGRLEPAEQPQSIARNWNANEDRFVDAAEVKNHLLTLMDSF